MLFICQQPRRSWPAYGQTIPANMINDRPWPRNAVLGDQFAQPDGKHGTGHHGQQQGQGGEPELAGKSKKAQSGLTGFGE